MTLWIIFALMTGAAVMAVLWPLSRRIERRGEEDPDQRFYHDQIAEVARDEARGLLSPVEAEAARAEAARRLLRAAAASGKGADAVGEPALRRRRAVSALTLSTVPLVALALYGALGSPQLPAQPLAARLETDPKKLDMAAAIARIEAHLAQHPDDGRGWEVIAPVYLRFGRMDNAVKAYESAIRLLGESAPRLASYGEALVLAKEGMVPAAARAAFERALALDPTTARARFYLAQAAEQDGDGTGARVHYEALLAGAPSDAPWLGLVKERLAQLPGGTGPASSLAALPAQDREKAIAGMVEGLARRLGAEGGSADEWQRLVRSYAVLGQRGKAEAALGQARQAFAQDRSALERIDATAQELGLAGTKP